MFRIKNLFSPLSKLELLTRLIFYGLIFFISISFLLLLIFLHQRFYLTLLQAEDIVILRSQLAVETLDADLFNKVKSAAEERKIKPAVNWKEIPNPFQTY